MIKAEFHCHTCYSKDSLVKIEDLENTARKKGLQRVVITDHNMIQGALKAHAMNPEMFIAGEEIMTQQGELLGFFVKELIPPRQPAIKTIEILHSQGAFISVAHPFDSVRAGSWELSDLLHIIPFIDAIEVFNSRCMTNRANRVAQEFAHVHNLLGTVGSDSHTLYELGSATLTLAEFHDPSSLRQALREAETNNRLSSPWVHLFTRYASLRNKIAQPCR